MGVVSTSWPCQYRCERAGCVVAAHVPVAVEIDKTWLAIILLSEFAIIFPVDVGLAGCLNMALGIALYILPVFDGDIRGRTTC